MYVKKEVTVEGETTVIKLDEVPESLLEKAPRLPKPGECVLVDEFKEIRLSGGGRSIVVRTYLCAEKDEKSKRSRKSRRKKRSRK